MAKKAAAKKTTKKPSKEELQPEVNIGLIGHVDHGKTTLTERMSGKWTDTHSEEIRRGITIRLGYANTSIYKCKKSKENPPYTTKPECPDGSPAKFVRNISLVDAPGHESLMATMLSGATIMDGAILMVTANEECPQPQTREHLQALEIIGVKNVIVAQNKIDLVTEEQAQKNYKQVKDFLSKTIFKDVPIIPISAQHGVNVGLLLEAIEKNIPTPKRDSAVEPLMLVARSFDVNKPGTKIGKLNGGVLGGSLRHGVLKVGDDIEIRPGRAAQEKNQIVYYPIKTKVMGLMTGSTKVEEAGPGGSIAVMTTLDPAIIKSDKLAGSSVGHPGKLPPVWDKFTLEIHLLERVVGAKDALVVQPVKMGEPLMLNVSSAATVGVVSELQKGKVTCKLKLPVCAETGSRVTISRNLGNRWRLIGYGMIQ